MELLANTSDAEKAAYRNLLLLGFTDVVKQQPIWTGKKMYFADLFIPSVRVILEIDGGYHTTNNQKRLDNNRSQGIWRKDLHVLRLTNREARDITKVKQKLKRYII
jgi:very-short-patch-repair endonuclease